MCVGALCISQGTLTVEHLCTRLSVSCQFKDAVLEEMKEDGTIADILTRHGVDAEAALAG